MSIQLLILSQMQLLANIPPRTFLHHLTCDNGTVLSKNNSKALTKFTFVDQYIKVEENNLEFWRLNQTKFKAALYNVLADAVAQEEEVQEG